MRLRRESMKGTPPAAGSALTFCSQKVSAEQTP